MGNRLKKYKTIEGNYKEFRPLGYCHLRKHQGFIDEDINNRHHCIQKKCLFFEQSASRSDNENLRREKLMETFVNNVKELFEAKELTNKEYYKLMECKSTLYAQKFLNNLKRGYLFTGIQENDDEINWDDEYYDIRVEKSKNTIGDMLSYENKSYLFEKNSKTKFNYNENDNVLIAKVKSIIRQFVNYFRCN